MAVPTNIPKGTYVTDGVRSGPTYNLQTSVQADINGVLLSGNRGRIGKGVLFSATNTYDFVPYTAPGAPGTTGATAPDVVGTSTVAATGTRDLPLVGNGTSAVLTQASNGSNYLQFDWPRVVSVTVGTTALLSPATVTLFGFDYYGFPLQHTYTLAAGAAGLGTYPNYTQTANQGGAATIPVVQLLPTKAFYGVTRVSLTGSLIPNTTTISLQTTNTFGLPYRVRSYSAVNQYAWAGNDLRAIAGVTAAMTAGVINLPTRAALAGDPILLTGSVSAGAPTTRGTLYGTMTTANTGTLIGIASTSATDIAQVSYLLPNSGKALVIPADVTAVATATTGDVRGLIILPEPGDTWAPVPDAARRCIFTPYVFGADTFQNQLASAGQPQGLPAGSTTPFLTSSDLYGVQQFYTGVPS